MIKEFKTSKGDFLAVMVSNEATKFKISGTGYLCHKIKGVKLWIVEDNIRLDVTLNYSIISLLSEITEDQAKEISQEGLLIWEGIKYHDYNKPKGDFSKYYTLNTALESFKSLMQSIECYSVNPYNQTLNFEMSDENFKNGLDRFEKAQANTGKWLILKQI